jgi:hypothetical protein
LGSTEVLVAKRRISGGQPVVLGDRLVQAMPTRFVDDMNFRPGRREKDTLIVAMETAQGLDGRLSRQVLEGDRGVD